MAILSSTPLPALELILAALRLFSASFARSLPYAFVPVLLLFALLALGYAYIVQSESDKIAFLYLVTALLLLCPALMAPLIYRVHALAHGRKVTAFEALRRGARCFLPCMAAALLYTLAIGMGSVLLVLPGLYLFIALSFWWLALVVDGMSILHSLRASLRLVRGHWWRVAVGYSFIYPVAIGINAFDVNSVSLSNEILEVVVATFVAVLLTTLMPMFVSANMVVIHHDLTLRSARAQAAETVVPA
jgi:hypothetical protein